MRPSDLILSKGNLKDDMEDLCVLFGISVGLRSTDRLI